MTQRTLMTVIGCALALAACETVGERTLGVDATGVVAGRVNVDRDGDGQVGPGDLAFRDLELVLRSRTGRGVVGRTTSQANGLFFFSNVAVGEYEVTVAESAVPDSLVVLRIDSANVRLAAGDTTFAAVVLSYPTVDYPTARTTPIGRTVFVEGVVLNGWSTFGDSTMHLASAEHGLRLIRTITTSVVVGDSVRVLGIRGTRDGQPVLHSARVFFLRTVEPRDPHPVETGVADHADDGALDARLIRITAAAATDTLTLPTGDFRITVDDGSGPMALLLDRSISTWANIAAWRFSLREPLLEHEFDVTGVLVPNGDGTWSIKPRVSLDLTPRHVPPEPDGEEPPPGNDGGE